MDPNKGPKACTTCAKAKARCIPGGDGDKCERCSRLNKECFSRPPAPPRIKKRPKRSRVAELEKRLNELSSQVTSNTGQPRTAHSPDGGDIAVPAAAPSEHRSLSFGHLFPSPDAHRDDEPTPSTTWTNATYQTIDSLWPLADEAASMLADFERTYESVFPFVILNKTLTSEELHDHRPFVWKAVMMVSSLFDASRQVRLADKLLSEIAMATLADGAYKTLDVLQSLHLLIGWYHYGLKGPQLTNLLFLARSLCVNLATPGGETASAACKYSELDTARAIAATYYLNTLVFTTNKKTEIFMNTKQLEKCCKAIDAKREFPSDVLLLNLIRIQLIAHKITMAVTFDPSQPLPSPLPLMSVVQSFQQQIDSFTSSLPEELKDNTPILAHVYIAEILLKDISISEAHCNAASVDITDRLQLLWSCIRSLRMFYQIRYVGRDIEKPRFLNLTASDVAFTLITSIRLLSVKLPGWDLAQVQSELNLEEILTWLIEDLGLVVEKRRNGRRRNSNHAAAEIAEDPLARLWRLLHNAKELVQIQLRRAIQAYGTEGEISPYMFGEVDESLWFDLVAEAAWGGMGDDPLTINVM